MTTVALLPAVLRRSAGGAAALTRTRRLRHQAEHLGVVELPAAVDAFYKAALAAGGKDNGAPGIRAQYHPDYYAAFVLDPDGHNIEAVCHGYARQINFTA